jgi:hypothetical protein
MCPEGSVRDQSGKHTAAVSKRSANPQERVRLKAHTQPVMRAAMAVAALFVWLQTLGALGPVDPQSPTKAVVTRPCQAEPPPPPQAGTVTLDLPPLC